MNRVVLSGRLARPPYLKYCSGMAVAMLRLLVPRDPLSRGCRDIVAEVDCIAFYEVAAYLATWGEAGSRVSVDGRLCQESLFGDRGQVVRTLCVQIQHAAFLDPLPVTDFLPAPRPDHPSPNGTTPRPPAGGKEHPL